MFHVKHITENIHFLREKGNFSENQLKFFEKFQNLLIEWNKKFNLISEKDTQRIISKHFLPAIAIIQIIEIKTNTKIIDIGSGGGLPGIPIKILKPDINLVLIDSIKKKTLFLKKAVEELLFTNVRVECERIEKFALNQNENLIYDICISRAVGDAVSLPKICEKLLKKNGKLILFKDEEWINSHKNEITNYEVKTHRHNFLSNEKQVIVELVKF